MSLQVGVRNGGVLPGPADSRPEPIAATTATTVHQTTANVKPYATSASPVTFSCSSDRVKATLQLKHRLDRSKALSQRVVAVDSADKLTDPQIVAEVKEHYGIDR